ncbi:MAG: FMN-binding protein [Melioribacteraceae bacterium]
MNFTYYKKYIVFLLIFFFSINISAGELRKKAEEIIKENFSDDIIIKMYKLHLDKILKVDSEKFAKQRFYSKFVYYFEIKQNDENITYAILDNVKGKVKPITFLVLFKNDLTVSSVEIVKYREEHGGEVENKSWLSQFSNKSFQSPLKLDEDIDGISGATISVKAITKGVKRLLHFINNLKENERD